MVLPTSLASATPNTIACTLFLQKQAPRVTFKFTMFRTLAPHLARSSRQCAGAVRTHMNHGGGGGGMVATPGPRLPLPLGLESARATQNILRLLEGMHSHPACADTLSTSWHAQGRVWKNHKASLWEASKPERASTLLSTFSHPPSLLDLVFADDRTASARLQGIDGNERFVSMLKLESDMSRVANDGWRIVREVIGGGGTKQEEESTPHRSKRF